MIGLTVIINLLGQIFQDGGMIYNILLIIVGIALIVLSIKFLHSISKAFGHGAGMTVALFFVLAKCLLDCDGLAVNRSKVTKNKFILKIT